MFTWDMQDRIIECTNAKVDLIKQGTYPRPVRAKEWPPRWAERWQPLTRNMLMLFLVVHIAHAVSGANETYLWEQGRLSSTPSISRIMSRNKCRIIKAALGFQSDQEREDFQQLPKIGEMLHMLRTRCETRWHPSRRIGPTTH